jgi:hypothetical protein
MLLLVLNKILFRLLSGELAWLGKANQVAALRPEGDGHLV